MDENIIGEQNSIISENSDKKDFSTLYNFLQTTLNNHYEINESIDNTLFAKNIQTLYNSNIGKIFTKNNIITKENDADSTINIIAQFKTEGLSKDQFSIINDLKKYNDVVLQLAEDTPDAPIHCNGVCVGFCTITCGINCNKSCAGGEMTGEIYQGVGEWGCDCSSACRSSCGSCTGTCDSSVMAIADNISV